MSVRRIARNRGKLHEPCGYDIPSVLFRVMDKSDYIWDYLDDLHLCDLPKIVVFAHALRVDGWAVTLQLPSRDGDKYALTVRRNHEKKIIS